jgi:hypothetical protein
MAEADPAVSISGREKTNSPTFLRVGKPIVIYFFSQIGTNPKRLK